MRVGTLVDRYCDGHLEGSSHHLARLVLEALEDVGSLAARRLDPSDSRAAGVVFARSLIRVCRTPDGLVNEVRVALDREAQAYLVLALGDGPHMLVSRHGCGVTVDDWCEALSIVPLRPLEGP
jgi:hypothetical protein